MDAESSMDTSPPPVEPYCITTEDVKAAVFQIMDRDRDLPRHTRSVPKLVAEIEEKLNGPLTAFNRTHVDKCIIEWVKINEPRSKQDSVIIIKQGAVAAMRTPEDDKRFKYRLSPELAKILGQDVMSGHVVIKMMRSIVNKECERDEEDFLMVIPCERLEPIFNTGKFRFDEMVPYLRPHLLPL